MGYSALRALRQHIDQLNMGLLPDPLFEQPPTISLVPDEEVCKNCGKKLTLLKTRWRHNLYTLEIGRFQAHITQLCCKACDLIYSNEELSEILQPHCRFSFDVLIYVGKGLFVECLNETEIKRRLKKKNIPISQRKIGDLGKKFIDCLSLAHRACEAELKQFMSLPWRIYFTS